GVNQGLLDRAKFEPAARKAWTALVGCVDADGKLTNVQPVGADPKNFDANSTEPYGVGAFLLAGSEVYRMAILENTKPRTIKVTNPANFWRENETVEQNLTKTYDIEISKVKTKYSGKWQVMDSCSSRILDSQLCFLDSSLAEVTIKLLFQVDLAPNETRTF